MAELVSLSPIQRRCILLRNILEERFDLEELRTLCFDLDVDYDSLRGEGKAGKARELVLHMKRKGRLAELEAVARPERAIKPHPHEFHSLCEQLKEWEQVHKALQDLQNRFAPCRGLIYAFGRPEDSARSAQRQWEDILYKVDVEWQPCKPTLHKLRVLAARIRAIEAPYDPESGSGPAWYAAISGVADEIDRALYDHEVAALLDRLSAFGHRVGEFLYNADRAIRDVVEEIDRLSPG